MEAVEIANVRPCRRASGFTLLELLVALAVAVLLIMIAASSFREFAVESKLRSRSGELATDLNLARLEAIKRNGRVLVCAKGAGSNACVNTNQWDNGWVVCYDADSDNACDPSTPTDPNPIKTTALTDNALHLASTVSAVRFNAIGTSNGTSVLTLSIDGSASTRTTNVVGTGFITTVKN